MPDLKKFTRDEVAAQSKQGNLLIILSNKVYNVTKFLDEVSNDTWRKDYFNTFQHPGGCEVLNEQSGKDATEPFEDIGHSTDAHNMRESYLVGEIVDVSSVFVLSRLALLSAPRLQSK